MAELHELIEKIENPELRAQIAEAAKRALKHKQFGLVFEEHQPECTPLYDIPIRKGLKVSVRNGKANITYTVLKIADGIATCLPKNSKEAVQFAVTDLVATAELGDPIYPCLLPLGEVCNAPDSDLWHTLIEADNYHALQLLEYLYRGKVDCIYIDPPYNSRAKDWKYNNDYVDPSDAYTHSLWLSMMQKRLKLAKELLNPIDSVLIVTIDEKEYLHLGCLLEEMFPDARIQMVSSVINSKGVARDEFYRVNEYLYIVRIGSCIPESLQLPSEWRGNIKTSTTEKVRWGSLMRSGSGAERKDSPGCFYPVFISSDRKHFCGAGDPIPLGVDRHTIEVPDGQIALFPIHEDGTEGRWQYSKEKFLEIQKKGYVRISTQTSSGLTLRYISEGWQSKVENGTIAVVGRAEDGSLILDDSDYTQEYVPCNQWWIASHNATEFGSKLLKKIVCQRKFPFPKSLYAVHDTIRFFVANKPNALIVDFFAGSGTTLHAVNLLNAEDNGHRRCIMVTNNEISEEERIIFEASGVQRGSEEWASHGIARYITWPRTVCSILGVNVDGEKLQDEYYTYNSVISSKNRSVTQISFVDPISTLSLQEKKKVISSITRGILPGKLITEDSAYVLSEDSKHTISVLLDESKVDEWIEELSQLEHIDELLVITKDKKAFNRIKKRIDETLAPIEQNVPVRRPMSKGFEANAVFFKLGFLDKTKVSLGMQFKELLSTLWMKAGAIGKCPTIDEPIPDMLILPENKMAILNDENRFGEFAEKIAQHTEIDVVYLVTDYESSFVAMTQALEGKKNYQLYQNYLDNFRINAGRNSR